MFIFFRSARSQSTQRLEMRRGRSDEFVAQIPSRYMVGSTLSYYFKAEDRSQNTIGSLGTPREPFRVSIRGDMIGADTIATGSSLDGSSRKSKRRSYFSASIGLGTGFGQITKFAKPVKQPGARISEPGLALSPFHISIELDVWIYPWMAIGAYERLQIVEFTHLEGGRFKFRVYHKNGHSLRVRLGGGVGHIRHLVQLNGGQLDTTLEGIGSATLGLSYIYSISSLADLVISPDYVQMFGESPTYHLDFSIGVGFNF